MGAARRETSSVLRTSDQSIDSGFLASVSRLVSFGRAATQRSQTHPQPGGTGFRPALFNRVVTAQVVARSNYRGWGLGPVRRRWVGTRILVDMTPASRFEGVGGPFRP